MTGRICLVTGANRGLGRAIAQGLANLHAHVVMLCRDEARGEAARHEISMESGNANIDLMICDLASQRSIREFVDEFTQRFDELHVLIHNAGVLKGRYSETEDGIEEIFAVNHLAPFLMTNLLLEMLINSDHARVITISSAVHKQGYIDFDDLNHREKFNMDKAYNQSKLANILFTNELAERFAGTPATANSLEPGLVNTDLGREYTGIKVLISKARRFFMKPPEDGAQTAIYLATSPDLDGISGRHFADCRHVESSLKSNDPIVANQVWEVSAELVGISPDIKPVLSN